MTELDFEHKADQKLQDLERALLSLQQDNIEADLVGDTLIIEVPRQTPIVINRHRAAKQIWMSAARKAWHFEEEAGRWIDVKSKEELVQALEQVLSSWLGSAIKLR